MPIAKLIYKLPQEQEEFESALKAVSVLCVLSELDTWLRNSAKYEEVETFTVGQVRDKIRELKRRFDIEHL